MSEEKVDKNKKYAIGRHPNSLAALGRPWDSAEAKAAQLKGAAAKKANRIAREQLKMTAKSWKGMQDTLKEEIGLDSVELLRVIAIQRLEEGDYDGATDILKSIAEFEKPKLARIESTVETVNTGDLTDEELAQALKDAAASS